MHNISITNLIGFYMCYFANISIWILEGMELIIGFLVGKFPSKHAIHNLMCMVTFQMGDTMHVTLDTMEYSSQIYATLPLHKEIQFS